MVSGIFVLPHTTDDQNVSSYSYDLKCTGEEMDEQAWPSLYAFFLWNVHQDDGNKHLFYAVCTHSLIVTSSLFTCKGDLTDILRWHICTSTFTAT